MLISGGLNPESARAREHAKRVYETIRHKTTDCEYIARNTNFNIEQIQIVKNYIFKDSHVLSYGFTRFYPSYEMAESWRRLSEKKHVNIQKHDIILLYHELTEIMLLLQHPGLSQSDAHAMAESRYNYSLESKRFYGAYYK